MKGRTELTLFRPENFRAKLLVAMMLVVSAITALVLYVAEHNLAREAEQDMQRQFQSELATLRKAQALRQAALVERSRTLVQKSRIHAALEDNALDLLYPSARDELRDIMGDEPGALSEPRPYALHAQFYRFLDHNGRVISSGLSLDAGALTAGEEAQLVLNHLTNEQQIGYFARIDPQGREEIAEIIAMPIVSSETGEVIAALVLGFKPEPTGSSPADHAIQRGVWMAGQLHLSGLAESDRAALRRSITAAIATQGRSEGNFPGSVGNVPHQIYYNRLNPDSRYPAAYEVGVYSLDGLLAQQRKLRWQIIGAGALLLLGGLGASHFLSGRLSKPVEKLAVDSAENRVQRERVEAALETVGEELQRSSRFSADASHQLKTPLAVLRAGLEELQARPDLTPEANHEISALMHQTYRLSSVIDDLLLLSRMDADQLKLNFGAVDFNRLVELALDDLGAQPEADELAIEKYISPELSTLGDKHYTSIILQNLLENARKYNRRGGRIRIAARRDGESVFLAVGNTGEPIPASAQEHIFERFHRGAIGENIPGYGLGLNLARELARLHGGDLRLVGSENGWTEFEVRLCAAHLAPLVAGGKA
jgi:signal transduction histidine kinase